MRRISPLLPATARLTRVLIANSSTLHNAESLTSIRYHSSIRPSKANAKEEAEAGADCGNSITYLPTYLPYKPRGELLCPGACEETHNLDERVSDEDRYG